MDSIAEAKVEARKMEPTGSQMMPHKYISFSTKRRKRLASEHVHRIGPAPREDVDLTKERKEGPKLEKAAEEIGALDGNLESYRTGY